MKFTIEGKPFGKQRPQFSGSHAYTPEKTREYEKAVAWSFARAGGEKLDGYIEVNITAFYQIGKDTTKRVRGQIAQGLIRPHKPDIDNVIKIILDGLNGVAYEDDRQVVCVSAKKEYSDEPRVVVEVKNYEG